VLARVPELSVAARTSSFQFKARSATSRRSPRSSRCAWCSRAACASRPTGLRITAQLIDAQTGFHLWSQTYDRKLEDIFAIQDEMRGRSATNSRCGCWSRRGRVLGQRHEEPEGHDLYLRGLAQWQVRRDNALWAAKESFEQAIAADPGYAEAWGGLALCYAVIFDYTVRISAADASARAREAAERALVLDPTLAEPYAALGNVENKDQHYETAIALLKRAISLKPSFATAHQWLGPRSCARRDPGGARVARARRRARPRSLIVASNYSSMLLVAGRNAMRSQPASRLSSTRPSPPCVFPTSGPRTCWMESATWRDRTTTNGEETGAPAPTVRSRRSSTRWKAEGTARRSCAGSPRPLTEAGNDPESGNLFSDWDYRHSSC